MKLIRTFHPVGFGAFYTEKHIDPTSKQSINVVYDCGTLHNKHYIKDAIRSYFKQGDYIDLLIILPLLWRRNPLRRERRYRS